MNNQYRKDTDKRADAKSDFFSGKRVCKIGGELIAPFIVAVAVMTFNPDEFHLVKLGQSKKPFPEVGIFKLFLSSFPALLAPGIDPSQEECVNKIFRV